jgi:hypothetical protein
MPNEYMLRAAEGWEWREGSVTYRFYHGDAEERRKTSGAKRCRVRA